METSEKLVYEIKDTSDEQLLLACMLTENAIIQNVYNSVKPEAFLDASNRMIYKAILELTAKGVHADIVTVYKQLLSRGVEHIDAATIAHLPDLVCGAANWSFYAGNVKKNYLRGAMESLLTGATRELIEGQRTAGFDIQGFIDKFLQDVSAITNNVTGSKCYDMSSLIRSEIDYIQMCMSNKRQWLGLDTGFPGFNNITNGLQPVFMVIGARPSMGKTALAQKMAMNISRNDKVLFIELEMSPRQLTERAISNLTQIPFRKIQSGLLTQSNMDKLAMKMDELAQNKNFVPCEVPGRQLSDIVNTSRDAVRNRGCKAIFIDHIGLIRCNYHGQAYDKARYISNTLQQLQRELGVPVVALSQLTREVEQSKKGNLAAFRGSGAIEEDADICVFINRERAEEMTDTNIPAEIVVGKNRDGAVGSVEMLFQPEIVNFVDNSESYTERMEREKMEREANKVTPSPNAELKPELEPMSEPEPDEDEPDEPEFDIF